MPIVSHAQTSITGTITENDGTPLTGASVIVKGTTKSVAADINGKFTLSEMTPGQVLQISYLGYDTKEIRLGNETVLHIVLNNATIALEQVVVTALGITRKAKALGYAIAEVKGADVSAGRDMNAISSLSGKVAGVDISTTSAGPSGSTRVIIRGNSQLSGSNLPLYVI
ncbi:MAG: carboxypeptidase-like regulatory domain-containing protein, partial [Prevotellaceae bacterium]|nr:carboxypeptidase-like regulatory domain-containing protein [Prevotellaceae bacterium]